MLGDLLKTYWRPATAVLGACLAFGAGRFLAPTKVETKTVERVVTQDRIVTQRVEVQAEAKTRVVYRDHTVLTHPDGTVERRDVEREADSAREVAARSDVKSEAHTKAAVKTLEKTVERDAPRLYVGALVGADLGHGLAPTYGGQVAYRALGPVWVGAFGLSSGVGGVSVGFEF